MCVALSHPFMKEDNSCLKVENYESSRQQAFFPQFPGADDRDDWEGASDFEAFFEDTEADPSSRNGGLVISLDTDAGRKLMPPPQKDTSHLLTRSAEAI